MKKCPPLLRLPSCLLFYFTPNPISSCLRCEQGLLSLSTPLLLLSKRAPAPCLSNRNRPRVQASTSSTAFAPVARSPFFLRTTKRRRGAPPALYTSGHWFRCPSLSYLLLSVAGYYHLVPLDIRPRGRGLYGSERGCAEENCFCV